MKYLMKTWKSDRHSFLNDYILNYCHSGEDTGMTILFLELVRSLYKPFLLLSRF